VQVGKRLHNKEDNKKHSDKIGKKRLVPRPPVEKKGKKTPPHTTQTDTEVKRNISGKPTVELYYTITNKHTT
jgi:hypothetical protein